MGYDRDVNAANRKGETALILAATHSNLTRPNCFCGKALMPTSNQERTDCADAAINGSKQFDNENHVVYSSEIAKLLVGAGADVAARDNPGEYRSRSPESAVMTTSLRFLEHAGARP